MQAWICYGGGGITSTLWRRPFSSYQPIMNANIQHREALDQTIPVHDDHDDDADDDYNY